MVISKDHIDSHLSFQKSIIEYKDYVLHIINSESSDVSNIDINYPNKVKNDRILVHSSNIYNSQNHYNHLEDRVQSRLSQFSYIWKNYD